MANKLKESLQKALLDKIVSNLTMEGPAILKLLEYEPQNRNNIQIGQLARYFSSFEFFKQVSREHNEETQNFLYRNLRH